MVAFAAGRLTAGKLVSLWGIRRTPLHRRQSRQTHHRRRNHLQRSRDPIPSSRPTFLCSTKPASWIGSIANQARATLGGNLVNGSPAADSSPALLVYDAEIELVSVRGKRRMPYREFHTGYKQNAMTADELLYAVHLPRRFANHRQYLRKVGTRRAMAISKVALGATALDERRRNRRDSRSRREPRALPCALSQNRGHPARHTRSAAASSKPRAMLCSPKRSPSTTSAPTREYRKSVGANLLEEFLREPESGVHSPMNPVLDAWNAADASEASRRNARLLWRATLGRSDGRPPPHPHDRQTERSSRPRLGSDGRIRLARSIRLPSPHRRTQGANCLRTIRHPGLKGSSPAPPRAAQSTMRQLAEGNALYEQRFGFTYIVCATGKSADEMLAILQAASCQRDRAAELREAAEQQRQIMQIRLGKWLVS